jgi:hypothetical protein
MTYFIPYLVTWRHTIFGMPGQWFVIHPAVSVAVDLMLCNTILGFACYSTFFKICRYNIDKLNRIHLSCRLRHHSTDVTNRHFESGPILYLPANSVICFNARLGCLAKAIVPGSDADRISKATSKVFQSIQKTAFGFPWYIFFRTKHYRDFLMGRRECARWNPSLFANEIDQTICISAKGAMCNPGDYTNVVHVSFCSGDCSSQCGSLFTKWCEVNAFDHLFENEIESVNTTSTVCVLIGLRLSTFNAGLNPFHLFFSISSVYIRKAWDTIQSLDQSTDRDSGPNLLCSLMGSEKLSEAQVHGILSDLFTAGFDSVSRPLSSSKQSHMFQRASRLPGESYHPRIRCRPYL